MTGLDIPIKQQGNPPKKPITIGHGAWIGANSTVMADVGNDAIVGAGSVVTKPVPPICDSCGESGKADKNEKVEMTEKVSVIIPTYNYGRFISEAIESVLAQTFPIQEIIVVDDGSTDETEESVRKFGDKVRYIKQKNLGVSAARNNGVENSDGDFIAFLDSDDVWFPEKIEKQIVKFQENKKIGLVHCGMREFDSETGETIHFDLEGEEGWVADDLLLFEKPSVNVSGSVIMVSRKSFNDAGGFDTRLKNGEDWEFCYRIARKYKVGFVAEALVNYRNHGINAHLNIKEMERSTLIAWNKAFDTKDEKILRLKRRAFGNLHKVLAGSYLQSGRYLDFLKNLIKSLWFRPTYLGYYLTLPFKKFKKQTKFT